jgi:hypothetical protein
LIGYYLGVTQQRLELAKTIPEVVEFVPYRIFHFLGFPAVLRYRALE